MGKLFAPHQAGRSAAWQATAAQSRFEHVASHGRNRAEATVFVWIWLASYAALVLLNVWLWNVRGAMSNDLLELEAQRRLIVDVWPPYLAGLIQTRHPLTMGLAVLAGSALHSAALLGATAITILARYLRAAGAPRIWLPLLVLQPAVLLALAQHPSAIMRSLLVMIALASFCRYLQTQATYQVLCGALALGALMLADTQPWPLLATIVLIQLIAKRRTWRQHLTVLLISLFPAVCISLVWGYVQLVEGSRSTSTAFDLLAMEPHPFVTAIVGLLTSGITACVGWLLATIQLFKERRSPSNGDRTWLALVGLLALPLVDLLTPHPPSIEAWLLAATAPLLTLPLLAQPLRSNPIAQGLIGTLLVLGLFTGWNAVDRGTGEPHQLLAQALGQPIASPVAAYRAVANELNTRLAPGERVLVDSDRLAPLISLVQDAHALLVPQEHVYALARQTPARWVAFIVIADDDPLGVDVSGYQLLLHQDGLALYQKAR